MIKKAEFKFNEFDEIIKKNENSIKITLKRKLCEKKGKKRTKKN